MNSTENGFVVAILELGAWAGAWIVGYFADKISRRYSIVLFSIVFLLGSAIVSLKSKIVFFCSLFMKASPTNKLNH